MTRLIAGPYLLVVTKKKLLGQINGQNVWQMTGAEIICCTRTLLHLTEKQASIIITEFICDLLIGDFRLPRTKLWFR
jgi:hypothetical protein